MNAIRKIEAALAMGPTEGIWKCDEYGTVKVGRFSLTTPSAGGSFSMTEEMNKGKANAALIAACNPAAIREVLQTLASKEAELAEAGLKYVSLFGELQSAMGEIERLREALKPLAALLQNHNSEGPDDSPIFAINGAYLTRGDLRRAAALTQPTE